MAPFEFEVFDKRAIPYVKRPQITIQAAGGISFNAAAHRALGEPEAVELLYDRKQRVIGFRAVALEAPQAYPLRRMGATATSFLVAGRAFLIFFEIPFGTSVRHEAEMVDGVLTVDLKKPGKEAPSNRTRRKTASQSPTNNGQQGGTLQDHRKRGVTASG